MLSFEQQTLNFIDVETTGMYGGRDRIIEVAIIKVRNNEIIDEYSTLVDPGLKPSKFILDLTGIKYNDLVKAPSFEQIAEQVHSFLGEGIFVAHNARFDYSFIKQELLRCGINYAPPILCTVRLSRALYPQFKSHSLASITQRLNIILENHHRAYDDAKSLIDFINISRNTQTTERFNQVVSTLLKTPATPPNISRINLENLPEGPGVYIFYDESDQPLYVGMSKNIKQRVFAHFYDTLANTKEMKMAMQVKKVKCIQTAGTLGASLREAQLVKTLSPIYNRKLRRTKLLVVAALKESNDGYYKAEIQRVKSINPDEVSNILGVFRSLKQAKSNLSEIAKVKGLCPKYLGVESNSSGICFNKHLGYCMGACDKSASIDQYNQVFFETFNSTRLTNWEYDEPIEVVEKFNDLKETFNIDKWCLINSKVEGSLQEEYYDLGSIKFDIDNYRIFKNYLKLYSFDS